MYRKGINSGNEIELIALFALMNIVIYSSYLALPQS
jgi:hypothetical protein